VAQFRATDGAVTHAGGVPPPAHLPRLPRTLLTAGLVPPLLSAAAGAWLIAHPDRWPQRLIVHWGLHGPNGWVRATGTSLLMVFIGTALICLLLAVMGWGILLASRPVRAPPEIAQSVWRFRRLGTRLMIVCEYFLLVPPLCGLLAAPNLVMQAWAAALAVTLLLFIVRLLHTGVATTRAIEASWRSATGAQSADSYRLGGLVYFNRADPSLWIEKRIGVGWTLNFANPWSWVLLALLLAIPVAFHLLLHHH
jgi:uncharacterized membrane protein